MEMAWNDLAGEVDKLKQSFPDFCLIHKFLKDGRNGEPVAARFVAVGTHTGVPFGFGPCEPIPAQGKKVINDPEEFHYFFRKGKICRIRVYPQGDMTGPSGFYTQIGGFPLL